MRPHKRSFYLRLSAGYPGDGDWVVRESQKFFKIFSEIFPKFFLDFFLIFFWIFSNVKLLLISFGSTNDP